ncbi:MAG: hypothetical protein JO076_07205 [Verrucomicrobia bacterium]|nr:hypothetical protein [Verrucomicrobiota bacterium]
MKSEPGAPEGQSAPEQSFNITHSAAAKSDESQPAWLRMDPTIARDVLAKTEEDLLGGLAALMRNKVENEKLQRKLNQVQLETQLAQNDLHAIREQIRNAEEELAFRTGEQTRINTEIAEVQQKLQNLQGEEQKLRQIVQSLKDESTHFRAQAERLAADSAITNQTAQKIRAELTELRAKGLRFRDRLRELQDNIRDLETRHETINLEVNRSIEQRDRIKAELEQLFADRDRVKEEAKTRDLELQELKAEQSTLLGSVEQLRADRDKLIAVVSAMPVSELTSQEQDPVISRRIEAEKGESDLELLFSSEPRPISDTWDSYRLESEFYTDEPLDAEKIARLVRELPDLEDCLIVRNRDAVLGGELAAEVKNYLRVQGRDYQLLFDRLPNPKQDSFIQGSRLATFELGTECLTMVQAKNTFVFVTHNKPKLLPGVLLKLASVANEVAEMYG